jgi:hypothetical protein
MEYGDLVHLLTTRFVNPGLLLTVSFAGEPCAVDGARIARTDGAALTPEIMARFLERLHRFVRLQRRLGWTAYELDAALVALRVGDFDEPDFLPELAALASLSSELGMPVGELRSWWRDLDTYRYTDDLPSAYEAVYLDERVFPDAHTGTGPNLRDDVFALTEDRTDLVVTRSTEPGISPWLAESDGADGPARCCPPAQNCSPRPATGSLGTSGLLDPDPDLDDDSKNLYRQSAESS